jgi:hypothetical protein
MGSFPRGEAAGAWSWPLQLVMRSRMHGTIRPLPNTPSWRGARLETHTFSWPKLAIVKWTHNTCTSNLYEQKWRRPVTSGTIKIAFGFVKTSVGYLCCGYEHTPVSFLFSGFLLSLLLTVEVRVFDRILWTQFIGVFRTLSVSVEISASHNFVCVSRGKMFIC